MHHRVFFSAVLAEVFQNGFHIRLRQNLCKVIYQPRYAVIEFRAGDVIEQLAQERIGLR